MTKRKWLSLGLIVVGAAVVLAIFAIVFQNRTGVALPWWAYLIALLIYVLVVYLIYLLAKNFSQRFENMLAKEGSNIDKQYKWNGQLLFIDFEGKRLANTYITIKPLVKFSEIAGYRYEIFQVGSQEELPDDKRFVSLILTVKKEGCEYEYLYIPMFEVALNSADVDENISEITPELVEKYPDLKEMAELQEDVKRILEINKADGVVSNVRKN